MRFVALLALCALSAPAIAQQAAPDTTDAAKPADAKKKKNDDPNRQICRRPASSSSRLGGAPECHTKAQWDEISKNSNNSVSRDLRN